VATQSKVDPSRGPVSWSLSVSNLKLGVYHAMLYDATGNVLERWDDMRTDDGVPDTYKISTLPAALPGCTLWWQAVISDPSNAGGPFVCVVTTSQGGEVTASDAVSGTVGEGSGQLQLVGDQIKFV
jgi:hypothetical protein